MRRIILSAIATLLVAVTTVAAQQQGADWQGVLQQRVRSYGHRNWIVIADSAYPAQSAEGVETIVTGANYFDVLQATVRALEGSKHVAPTVYTDRELAAIAEDDAPGISGFREQLLAFFNTLQLRNPVVQNILHEKLIAKLAEVSRTYQVLILKTNLTLPFTSVFLELDCAYWSPEAEHRLRSTLAAQAGR